MNVHDLLRSEVEKVSSEIFPSRTNLNHHMKTIHEDSKSDKNTDHLPDIDRSMGMKVALANEKSHVEDQRFATNQNLPYR